MSIRVVIADDHPIVRDGLRFCIERSGKGIEVVGEAGNGKDLLDLATLVGVDVFIVDVTMPLLNGIEATRELIRRDPATRVIMLTLHASKTIVDESLKAGARAFLSKESATRKVVEAIQEVWAGRYYLDPEVTHHVVLPLLQVTTETRESGEIARLSPQERRVLQLIAEGHSSKSIAECLGVSAHTVHAHRGNIMSKLDIHNQAGLVCFAIREGIARP